MDKEKIAQTLDEISKKFDAPGKAFISFAVFEENGAILETRNASTADIANLLANVGMSNPDIEIAMKFALAAIQEVREKERRRAQIN